MGKMIFIIILIAVALDKKGAPIPYV